MTAEEKKEIEGLKDLLETTLGEIREDRKAFEDEKKSFSEEMVDHKKDHETIKTKLTKLEKAVEPIKKERDRFMWLGRLGITIFGAVSAIAVFWWICLQIYDRYKPVIKENL